MTIFNSIRNDISSYLFTNSVAQDNDGKDILIIMLVASNGANIISFTFKSIHSALFITKGNGSISKPNQGVFYQNLKMLELNYPMPDSNGIAANPIPDILRETQHEKLISFSPQYLKGLVSIYEQPFFMHDRDRSYYIKTVPMDYSVGYTKEASGGYKSKTTTFAEVKVAALRHPELVSYLPIHLVNLT